MSASNFDVLRWAVEREGIERLPALIKEGLIDINDQNNSDLTPLMLVCAHPHEFAPHTLEVVKILIEAGADVNLFDKKNDTVLNQLSNAINAAPDNEMLWELFYYLIRERKPHEATLQRAITILSELFSNEPPVRVKEEMLSSQLSIWFGLDAEDIQKDCDDTQTWLRYKLHLLDYLGHNKADGSLSKEGEIGNCVDQFLYQRIRLYLKIIMEINLKIIMEIREVKPEQSIDISMRKDKEENGFFVERETLVKHLQEEILTNLEIHWQEKARLACIKLPEERKPQALETIAMNIIQQVKCDSFEIGREYSFYSGYQSHCVYISLQKISETSVIVRVDNRWIQNGLYHHPIMISGEECFKPHYIGHFKFSDRELRNYLIGCLQALSDNSEAKIYPDPIVYGEYADKRKECLQRWPHQPKQQNGMGNCILSNHNYGVASRLGPKLSHWLFNKELSIVTPLSVDQIGARFSSSEAEAASRRRFSIHVPPKIANFSGATITTVGIGGFFYAKNKLTEQMKSTLDSYLEQIDIQQALNPSALIDEAIHQNVHSALAALSNHQTYTVPIVAASVAAFGVTVWAASWYRSRYTIFGATINLGEEREFSDNAANPRQNFR